MYFLLTTVKEVITQNDELLRSSHGSINFQLLVIFATVTIKPYSYTPLMCCGWFSHKAGYQNFSWHIL